MKLIFKLPFPIPLKLVFPPNKHDFFKLSHLNFHSIPLITSSRTSRDINPSKHMANLALSSGAQICREKYLSLKFNVCKLRREKLTAGFQKAKQSLVQLPKP